MKLGTVWHSFRFRIVILTTLGLWALLSVWMYGVYRLVLTSRLNEVDAQLSAAGYQMIPVMLFHQRERGIQSGEFQPELWQRLLLAYDRSGQRIDLNADLPETDLDVLGRLIPESAPGMEEHGGPPPGDPNDPGSRTQGPGVDRFPEMRVPPFLQLDPAPVRPRMEQFDTELEPVTVELSNGRWRCVAFSGAGVRFVLGEALDPVYRQSKDVLKLMAWLNPALLVLILMVTWLVVTRALRPIREMTELAGGIDADRLDVRLKPEMVPSEFQRLVDVFNSMLGRLERNFYQARRFSADAAHELKTPLTILQGQLEQEIAQEETGSSRQQSLSSLLDEVARLKHITEGLLLLALGDSGRVRTYQQDLDLRQLVEEIANDYEDSGLSWEINPQPANPVPFRGDKVLLMKAVQNLVSNATKYNRPEGRVRIEFQEEGRQLRFRIGNTGPAISPEIQPHVFDRFVRGDSSRNRKVDGTGLGLSIVQELVRIHGGTVALLSSQDDWTEFEVVLPRE